MPDDKDFQVKVRRIGDLVAGLDKIADAESRANAKALVQLLLDLHAVGLERTLEIIAKNEETGQRTIDDLGCEPLVSSLLALYGLHPLDFEGRVTRALERVQPRVRKGGGEVELLSIENATVRIRIQTTSHACGSTGNALKSMVEDALYEAAPEIGRLLVEGLEEQAGSPGFVPLGNLGGVVASPPE